jgi:hypothetical protein
MLKILVKISKILEMEADPSTDFGHSDRKKLSLTSRRNFVTLFIEL